MRHVDILIDIVDDKNEKTDTKVHSDQIEDVSRTPQLSLHTGMLIFHIKELTESYIVGVTLVV